MAMKEDGAGGPGTPALDEAASFFIALIENRYALATLCTCNELYEIVFLEQLIDIAIIRYPRCLCTSELRVLPVFPMAPSAGFVQLPLTRQRSKQRMSLTRPGSPGQRSSPRA